MKNLFIFMVFCQIASASTPCEYILVTASINETTSRRYLLESAKDLETKLESHYLICSVSVENHVATMMVRKHPDGGYYVDSTIGLLNGAPPFIENSLSGSTQYVASLQELNGSLYFNNYPQYQLNIGISHHRFEGHLDIQQLIAVAFGDLPSDFQPGTRALLCQYVAH